MVSSLSSYQQQSSSNSIWACPKTVAITWGANQAILVQNWSTDADIDITIKHGTLLSKSRWRDMRPIRWLSSKSSQSIDTIFYCLLSFVRILALIFISYLIPNQTVPYVKCKLIYNFYVCFRFRESLCCLLFFQTCIPAILTSIVVLLWTRSLMKNGRI